MLVRLNTADRYLPVLAEGSTTMTVSSSVPQQVSEKMHRMATRKVSFNRLVMFR